MNMIRIRNMVTRLLIVSSLISCAIPTMITFAHDAPTIKSVDLPEEMTFCGEAVPMHLPQVRERFEKEMLLSLWDRPQVILWLKRLPRYFPYIERQLKDSQIPDDIKYLAVAESALRPHAGSSKGAMGFWQLMPQTAQKFGLTVDAKIDDRRNLRLSTPAALAYLKTLYKRFGSWTLAVAGYNMGEEGLAAEVMEQDTKDYYHLYIPLETQRFVFRVLSVKLILSKPEKFGFHIKNESRYKPLDFDRVSINCYREIPIQLIAQAAGTFFKTIKDLNPHLRGYYVQVGHYNIDVPVGKAKGFNDRFDKLVADHNNTQRKRIYVVRTGDTLSEIADKFDVPLASILIWNRIKLNRSIQPGDRLIIHPRKLSDVKQ